MAGMDAIDALASLLAPPRCAACSDPCDSNAVICRACAEALATLQPLFGSAPGLGATWSAAPHEGVARNLVAALKFRRLLPVAGLFAARIADTAPAGLLAATLVPVPPAPARLLRRGFDPADEIAASLAALTGLPLRRCLTRGDGPRQVGRPRAVRLRRPPTVRALAPVAESALLVDDVHTTGATLCACARALRRAGATRVAAVTFARAL
jgi:predicted amidophosphoribosyltransferase